MRAQRWAITAFAVIGLLYVTGLVADRPLPFGGTLATAAVLVIALVARTTGPARLLAPTGPRWTRWAGLAGLATLTACAALVDAQHGGNGWPMAATEWWWGYDGVAPALLAEAGLLALAGALLAASVLGRAGPVMRVGNLPAATFALVMLWAEVVFLLPGAGPLGPGLVVGLALAALALLVLAVNAALLTGRPAHLAAIGLIPVVFALAAVTLTLVDQRTERARELAWQAWYGLTQGVTPLCDPANGRTSDCGYLVATRIVGRTADLHWWPGLAAALLLLGLLGVVLRGSRET
jgi:hypothetical protein